MLTVDFNYNLPDNLIAQVPAEPRDSSKLMIVNRALQRVDHRHFYDIGSFLKPGDLLVWNNSRVFKARLTGTIKLDITTDGIDDSLEEKIHPTEKILNAKKVEVFLVRPMENAYVWKVLAKPGKKLRLGMKVEFANDFVGEVIAKEKNGTILMQFADTDVLVREKANRYGSVPIPPYIAAEKTTLNDSQIQNRYQTVYATTEGSVAAPTAGFHFTPELIEKLKNKGVEFAEVTLHVGLGTFLPVKSDSVEDHEMHSEYVEVTAKNADLINAAKAEGRRVIAVGTTTVRTLEGVAAMNAGKVTAYTGDVNIFITPGFVFNVIDALITNFHLPKSTLLMLVSAFMASAMKGPDEGRVFALSCYAKAVENTYRFYSFGDSMFIE